MPTIVVSGQPGAGSSTTAKRLAKALKLKHWSAGEYVKTFGQSKKETQRAVEAWKDAASKKKFHIDLDKTTVNVALEGDVVIDGKLAIHFTKDIADYKIWLKCPTAVRAQRLAKRDRIKLAKATAVLAEKEKLERTNFKEFYGFDPFEQFHEADMVVDTSLTPAVKIVKNIQAELKKRKIIG